jgi:predicted house-cleaning NTP pyrophosphatase (Maf/HAM1 superfamily)
MSDIYTDLASRIIKQQEQIVGPLAWTEAAKVKGIVIDNGSVTLSGEGKPLIESLVSQYENLFGLASVEVCKEAVKPLLQSMKDEQLPAILK